MRRILFYSILSIGLLLSVNVLAANISVEAEINTPQVVLGQSLQYTLRINGTQNASPAIIEDIDDLEIKLLGPSRQMSVVNGQYSSSIAFNYSVFPLSVGTFTIPSQTLSVDGVDYTTDSISFKVLDSGAAANKDSNSNEPVALKDKIFMVLRTAKSKVYLNEKIPVKIQLFVRDLQVRDIQYPKVESVGFSVNDYDQAVQYQEVIKGLKYDIIEFNTTVYPTRIGELNLGPTQLDASLYIPSTNSDQYGRFNSIFDDDFFSGFFDRGQKRPVSITAKESPITVLPLPEENKPDDFSGAVGLFNFDVSVGPQQLKVGDPITLKMTIQGDGNLLAVDFPHVSESKDFKTYDPNVTEEKNMKRVEQVLIPTNKDITQVPAISFSYFNPELERYETITRGPFAITVEAAEEGSQPPMSGFIPEVVSDNTPEVIGSDIIYLKPVTARERIKTGVFFRQAWFYVMNILYLLLWSAAYWFIIHYQRLHSDNVYKQKFVAPKYARSGIKKAEASLGKNDTSIFYDTVHQTLLNYLSKKLQIAIGTVSVDIIEEKFRKVEKLSSTITIIRQLIGECEMIRYAAKEVSKSQMESDLNKLKEIIRNVEKYQS